LCAPSLSTEVQARTTQAGGDYPPIKRAARQVASLPYHHTQVKVKNSGDEFMTFQDLPFPARLALWLTLLVTAGAVTCSKPRAQSGDSCDPAPAVRAALDALPQLRQDPKLTDWQFYKQRQAGLQRLLREYPGNIFVQEAYIRSAATPREDDTVSVETEQKIIDEYKARHDGDPKNARLDYLYALALVGRQTPRAIKLLDAALRADPNFGLPHLELVTIYSYPAFSNKAKRAAHLKAFLEACPACLAGYQQLAEMSDRTLQSQYAGKLRPLLEARTDVDAVAAYQTLWSLEFKAHPPSEYPAVRRQVGRDLARLRELNLQDERQWYETLETGYNLTTDRKEAKWAESQIQKRFPNSMVLPEMSQWFEDHPWPASDAPESKRQAYFRDVLAQTSQWAKLRPYDVLAHFFVWEESLSVMERLDSVPAPEVEQATSQMLKFAGENMGDGPWTSDYLNAIEALSKKRLDPKRIVELAQKGMGTLQIELSAPASDLFTAKGKTNPDVFYENDSRLQLLRYEIDAYLQLKQVQKADPLLAQMNEQLQDFKALAGADQGQKQVYASRLASYWGLRAQEAELRGRKLDAMAFYENALLTRLNAQVQPETGERDTLAENAHRLWTSLGGSDHGWQLWYGRPANDLASQAALGWEKPNQPLPPFKLTDLSGKTWSLASLKGKVTFLNFWASWCGPCAAELPHLQKLANHNKSRSDVQIITFNLDNNPGLIQPFLKEHKLSLVVIPASSYATQTLKIGGIPENWIVDGSDVVRLKETGYGANGNWVGSMEAAIGTVRHARATPGSASK
jgi:thiol-disulfide isomerase/thioredoxin